MWMVASRSGCSSTIAGQQGAVGDVALVEGPVADEDPRPGQQRVEDDRRVAGVLERLGRGRADVAGAAGDENLHAGRVGVGRDASRRHGASTGRRAASRPRFQRRGAGDLHASHRWASRSAAGTMPGMPSALITGITGQDGLYLAELLLAKGYDVHGLIRGQNNPRRDLVERLLPDVRLHNGDLTDMSSLIRALRDSDPDEVYNLGAISFVAYSWENAAADDRRDRQGRARRCSRRCGCTPATTRPGALLPGVELGDVRQGAGGPAARDDPAVAALAVRRRQGLRPLHDHQLPRVLRHARLLGDPLQPRVAAPRAGVRDPQDQPGRRPDPPRDPEGHRARQPRRRSATGASPATTSRRCG